MTGLRRPLIALVALFTAAITIDRVGIANGSGAIGSHVYLLAAVAVIAPLGLPTLRRRLWLGAVLAAGAYLVLSALADGFAGARAHVVATEIAFIVLAARLGQMVSATMAGLDETLGAIAFGDTISADLESPEAAAEILNEMARSRRHDRPLTVTALAPTSEGLEEAIAFASIEVDRAMRRRYIFGKMARAVGDQLRRSDLLFEHRESGRLFVVSPETDEAGASLLVRRILDAVGRGGIESAAATASFPDDAVGFESLLATAEAGLDEALQPRLRAVVEERSA